MLWSSYTANYTQTQKSACWDCRAVASYGAGGTMATPSGQSDESSGYHPQHYRDSGAYPGCFDIIFTAMKT